MKINDEIIRFYLNILNKSEDSLLSVLLEKFREEKSLDTWVLLSLQRSDINPSYQKISYSPKNQDKGSFLVTGENISISWKPTSYELTRMSAQTLGPHLNSLFNGDILVLPIPGGPLGYLEIAKIPLAGLFIIGPLSEGKLEVKNKDEFLAIQLLLATFLWQKQRNEGHILVDKKRIEWPNLSGALDIQEMGQIVLRYIQKIIGFQTGVLYLRGGPPASSDPTLKQHGGSDDIPTRGEESMIFAASINENPHTLLHSYWDRSDLGLTWKAMTQERRTVAGRINDMPSVEKRSAKNDEALAHVTGGVHGAWALMPFFNVTGGEGVAVAHLEGINGGQGARREDWEAMQILGNEIGWAINKWRADNNPDFNLSATLYGILKGISRGGSITKKDCTKFEKTVKASFKDIPGATLSISEKLKSMNMHPDCYFELSGKRVVVEITLSKKFKQKMMQIHDYVQGSDADLGILILGRDIKFSRYNFEHLNKILVMDYNRIIRFVCLSPQSRRSLIEKWLLQPRKRMEMAIML